ncbi:MAG: ParB/RepB/Spo0J family partition protein [Mollicutes bacterium]|nr:ParB/RepB/Spo0J family partition protein [Mollicutes bacterium]
METKKKALGKGLEELFSNASFNFNNFEHEIVSDERGNAIEIDLDEIRSNPYQPRKTFNEESLNELADSIKTYGIIEPIIVKKSIKGYEIIAGERRTRAAKIAGLKTIPAIIKDFNDEEMMEIALLENIQREDLNPIDIALSIDKIIKINNYTQDEFAKRIGKSRSYITNLLGLLKLPNIVKEKVKDEKISMSHARSLSKLDDDNKIIALVNRIEKESLNVRDLERILSGKQNIQSKTSKVSHNYKMYEDAISDTIGNKVKINDKKIEIFYDSLTDLNRILEILKIEIED